MRDSLSRVFISYNLKILRYRIGSVDYGYNQATSLVWGRTPYSVPAMLWCDQGKLLLENNLSRIRVSTLSHQSRSTYHSKLHTPHHSVTIFVSHVKLNMRRPIITGRGVHWYFPLPITIHSRYVPPAYLASHPKTSGCSIRKRIFASPFPANGTPYLRRCSLERPEAGSARYLG